MVELGSQPGKSPPESSLVCVALRAVSEVSTSAGANCGFPKSRPCADGPLHGIPSRRLLVSSAPSSWTVVTWDPSFMATSLSGAREPPPPSQPLCEPFSVSLSCLSSCPAFLPECPGLIRWICPSRPEASFSARASSHCGHVALPGSASGSCHN